MTSTPSEAEAIAPDAPAESQQPDEASEGLPVEDPIPPPCIAAIDLVEPLTIELPGLPPQIFTRLEFEPMTIAHLGPMQVKESTSLDEVLELAARNVILPNEARVWDASDQKRLRRAIMDELGMEDMGAVQAGVNEIFALMGGTLELDGAPPTPFTLPLARPVEFAGVKRTELVFYATKAKHWRHMPETTPAFNDVIEAAANICAIPRGVFDRLGFDDLSNAIVVTNALFTPFQRTGG